MQRRFIRISLLSLCLISATILPVILQAQQTFSDTISLMVTQAEQIFLQKNLTLLANRYNIDANKALVLQAKVWDNPVLNTDQNIYDGKFFRHNKENGVNYGEVFIQVQQLIRTAGKIKKQTRLAQDNVAGAEAEFGDVLRNLKFILTTDLNNLAQLQNTAAVYENELQNMRLLVKGMDEMLKVGDISQKDNVRINALLFSLQGDYNDNLVQQYDLQKEIAVLLQLNDNIWVVSKADQPVPAPAVDALSMTLLQDSALQLRPDMAVLKNRSLYQQHNIDYQRALAKPDLNVGVEYDKLNSYVPDYYGLAISLPLPIFNRNRGNIEAAKLAYRQSDVLMQEMQTQVDKDVYASWKKLQNATAFINNDNMLLQDRYDTLMKNMVNSYRQRQVSLVEFIDFFDAYKETRIRQWQLITNQRNAAAELNYSVNKNIIPL